METEQCDKYEYKRLQLSTYMMYESFAYWKLAIEQLTLDLVVVIVYFGLVDLRSTVSTSNSHKLIKHLLRLVCVSFQ